jgi:peptide/nickel transport system permease protein
MLAFLFRRLLSAIPVMAIVAVVIFGLLHLAEGGPAAVIAGDGASREDVAAIEKQLGLDRPLLEQFLLWLGRIVEGDLGTSIFFKIPVLDLILQHIEPTLSLAAVTLVISVSIGIAIGVLSAARAGGALDHAVIAVAILGFSTPIFVIGYFLVALFALGLDWLPVQGYRPLADGLRPFFEHIALPSLALSFPFIALISRITRASVLEILAQDYIRTAYAKGFGEAKVLTAHVMRNAAVPITTVVGIAVALLMGGVVVTESVFNIPGMGRLVVDAISRRDYPVIQGITLMFAGVSVLINLLVDLCCALFDPRIRY